MARLRPGLEGRPQPYIGATFDGSGVAISPSFPRMLTRSSFALFDHVG